MPNTSKQRQTKRENGLTYHEIAARLRCDAENLNRFVTDHPAPSVGAVLGFAEADATHADAIERWLNHREEQIAARHDRLVAEHDAEDLNTSGRNFFADASEEKSRNKRGEA